MNKQSSWQECINTNATRIRTPDTQKAQSLTKIANQRQEFLLSTPLSQKNANFIFEGLYSCLIEHLHAHLLKQGYHVLNHICLGYYLRDILSRADLYEQFTTLRVRRNHEKSVKELLVQADFCDPKNFDLKDEVCKNRTFSRLIIFDYHVLNPLSKFFRTT